MKLALSDEQQKAVENHAPGELVEVLDPASRREYVLVAREEYERVRVLLEAAPLAPSPVDAETGVSPAMRRSQEAFWRDLPGLLAKKNRIGWWVCYHLDEQIGLARTGTELVQRCLGRGLERGQFYVARIDTNLDPPWEPREIEQTLYEVTEVTADDEVDELDSDSAP